MKKTLYSMLAAAAGLVSMASCDDMLKVSSPSEVDAEFVFSNTTTARAAMEGAYEQWRSTANSHVFGAGLFYAADIAGSDIERHPEGYTSQPARHIPEGFYENGAKAGSYDIDSYSNNNNTGCYVQLYNAIGKANTVITAMEKSESGKQAIASGQPSGVGQLYGEAIALRATCYRELLRFYGDVPFVTVFGVEGGGLVSRDYIYDKILEDLVKVEPLMYPVGSIPGISSANKNYFSKTYVQGLIGRIALEAGGYMTRRTDINYVDGQGKAIQFEKLGKPNTNADNCFYARRADWKDKYELAKTYLKKALADSGTAKLVTVDPRKAENGKVYNNPYQFFYQEMMNDDAIYATESIYEYPMQFNESSDERAYSNGRANTGSGTTCPTKGYGQCRINPAFYYGMYDPKDMRRDVTWAVTGVNDGVEVLIPLSMGSQAKAGGITMNKWDTNRMVTPNTKAQRKDGINGPYMHIGELYLSLAEACAATNEEDVAKEKLLAIRSRAFENYTTDDLDAFIAKCGNFAPNSGWSPLYKAIIEERGFEYAGEGDRRMTLIRTGLLPDAIKRIKDLTDKMIAGLAGPDHCYHFENGNVISAQIYTKSVDAKSEKQHRLTAQHLEDNDPVLYPGWRGTNDDWTRFGWTAKTNMTNLAIQGLFAPVADADALVADGYKAVDWGKTIAALKDEYYTNLFTNYDYESAPVYLWPICPNAVAAGGFSNGYGFMNE